MQSPFLFENILIAWVTTPCSACMRGMATLETNIIDCWNRKLCMTCGRGDRRLLTQEDLDNDANVARDAYMHSIRNLLVEWMATSCECCSRKGDVSLINDDFPPFPFALLFDALFGNFCNVCGLGTHKHVFYCHEERTQKRKYTVMKH